MSDDEQKFIDAMSHCRNRLNTSVSTHIDYSGNWQILPYIINNPIILQGLNLAMGGDSIMNNQYCVGMDDFYDEDVRPLILDLIMEDRHIPWKRKIVELQLKGYQVIYPTDEQIEAFSKPFKSKGD